MMGLYVVQLKAHLVPSQGVFRHDGGTDHLGASGTTAAVAGGTATGSQNRAGGRATLAHLLHGGAGALVELLSLAVAAGNPEHTGTVSGGTGNDTDSNANGAGLGLGAAGRAIAVGVVATVGVVITSIVVAAVSGIAIAAGVVAREFERNCRVNHRHQRLDGFTGLVVESRVGVGLEGSQGIHLVTREVEDGKSRVVASGLPVVVGLNGKHDRGILGRESGQSVLDGLRSQVEDLRRGQGGGGNKRPWQLAVETKLEQNGVRGSLADFVRGGDGAGKRGRRGGLGGLAGAGALSGGNGGHDQDGGGNPVVVIGSRGSGNLGLGGLGLHRGLGLGRARFTGRSGDRNGGDVRGGSGNLGSLVGTSARGGNSCAQNGD
ncbi:unnamed protein product [Penicillium olsonii]|uniref:Uncharacterized protein n=1 Tax=Penicillium olsonii TaxID=99116 RepID=A0A9W4HY01_PENOL|nr:unnamed protein product [Penicillium olsonii]CAG8161721.1 unnamed protein product [Penicillium olsonii]